MLSSDEYRCPNFVLPTLTHAELPPPSTRQVRYTHFALPTNSYPFGQMIQIKDVMGSGIPSIPFYTLMRSVLIMVSKARLFIIPRAILCAGFSTSDKNSTTKGNRFKAMQLRF